MRISMLLLTCFLLVVSGCSSTDSENVNTPGLYADYRVTSNGVESTVVGQLRVGGSLSNTVVELTNGDRLIATNGLQSAQMIKDESLIGDIEYYTTLTRDPDDKVVTITFERPSTNEIINSSITLPADFTVTSISPPAVDGGPYRRTDNLTMYWTPTAQSTTFHITGCSSYVATASPYTSGATINLFNLEKKSPLTDSCVLSVRLTRTVSMPVNAQFGEGGKFRASQVRGFSINFSFLDP